jgi:ATP-dependent DNA helicase DinG
MILPSDLLADKDPIAEDEVSCSRIFGRAGTLSEAFRDYEFRPQQKEMAESVEKAVRSGHHLIVEAGTGVGKSFAYLVPAADFAVTSGKKSVISTDTISLQEQLVRKDLPFVSKILPDEFKFCLVKGRSNYLCLRRLNRPSHQRTISSIQNRKSGRWGRYSPGQR